MRSLDRLPILSVRRFLVHLPLQFRTLYRQFLLRVVDLESLSVHADIPQLLGQLAGILIMFSIIQGGAALFSGLSGTMTFEQRAIVWREEQSLIGNMLLVTGIFVVFTWDSIFPDRRDVMILGPLPIRPKTILFAKLAASASLLGIAIVALNCVTGITWPLVIGGSRFVRLLPAYWLTMIVSSVFLYCSVVAGQGIALLLLPRRLYLRLSAWLQIAVLALSLGSDLMIPSLSTVSMLSDPQNHALVALCPAFWFFGLLNHLNGTLPPSLDWLAFRGWLSLAAAICGAVVALLLCYFRTMKRTVEEPDILPVAEGYGNRISIGNALNTAIMFFTLRSLLRSRQHRLAFACYLAASLPLTIPFLARPSPDMAGRPLDLGFMASTFVILSLSIVGLRRVFAIPIWLHANWIFQLTQLSSPAKYFAATRRSLLAFAALPAWLFSGLLSLLFRPLSQVAMHLLVVALFGIILVDLSVIGLSKIPFTCAYLPGKVNIQFLFWGLVIVVLPLLGLAASLEQRALGTMGHFASLVMGLGTISLGLWALNLYSARSAVIQFEETPPDVMTTLNLAAGPILASGSAKSTNSHPARSSASAPNKVF